MAHSNMRRIRKENRRGPSGPESSPAGETFSGSLDRATVITTVRRMGFIALKMHEVVMGRLISQGEHALAERFNDVFKPLVDLLVHFELDEPGEDDNGV